MSSTATEQTPLRGRSTGCGDTAFRVRLLTVIASLAEGYDMGIVANAIGPMKDAFGLDPIMIGLVVSSAAFAAMLASMPAGTLIDSHGRKPVIAISAALIFAGNLFWALAPNIIVLIIGRIILGSGIGVGIGAITVYMAEVAPTHQRGLYVSMEMLFLDVGILCGYAAGALLIGVRHDWRILVGLGAVLPLVIFIFALTPLLPESPRFLQAVGRVEEAREVLLDLLHGDEQEVDNAFAQWAAMSSQKSMD
jgi:MFS family permease